MNINDMWIIGAFLAAILAFGILFIFIEKFSTKGRNLSKKDRLLGFLLFGPFFRYLHQDLSKRSYSLSKREIVGILIFLFILAIGIFLIN